MTTATGAGLSVTSILMVASASNLILVGAALVGITLGIAAAIFTARNRVALEAARGSAEAWERERDAERSARERAEQAVSDLTARVAELTARTDLSALARVIEAGVNQMTRDHHVIIEEIRGLAKVTSSNTVALEYLARYVFPKVMDDESSEAEGTITP